MKQHFGITNTLASMAIGDYAFVRVTANNMCASYRAIAHRLGKRLGRKYTVTGNKVSIAVKRLS